MSMRFDLQASQQRPISEMFSELSSVEKSRVAVLLTVLVAFVLVVIAGQLDSLYFFLSR